MQLIESSFEELKPQGGQWVVTLGTFDGVHLGHQAIVAECRTQSDAHGLEGSCALSFLHHPRSVLPAQKAPRILTTVQERIALLRATGLDRLVLLRFDAQLAAVAYDRFVRELLRDRLGMAHLVLGHDVHFGKDRGGNVGTVADLAELEGFTLSQVPSIRDASAPISSTRIRDLVARGEVEAAARLLGHPHVATGSVVEGRRLGRKLGFPTANLEELGVGKLLPGHGVYAAWTQTQDGEWHPSVVNIGTTPTVNAGPELKVEAHLLGFEGELYGQRLGLAFRCRLREERQMAGLDELRAQIERDVEAARGLPGDPPAKLQLLADQGLGATDPA